MKIAITGHTAGIGQAFAKRLSADGHEIIGISKRDGNNIRNIPKIRDMIVPADLWINNAQSGYAQTELLYAVWESWAEQPNKMIWLISTILTKDANLPAIPGQDALTISQYKTQKQALEQAFYNLRSMRDYQVRPDMILIRPGATATQPYHQAGIDAADVDDWVNAVVEYYRHARSKNLWISEISLGFKSQGLDI